MVRVAFFGTPAFAVPALSRLIDRCDIIAVVTQPDRPRNRGHRTVPTPTKQVAVIHSIPTLAPARADDPTFLAALRELAPDLGVVAAYGKILPEAVLAVPRHRMVNLHASLLPKHRGASPVQHAILAGDRLTGVTLMRIVAQLDAGPILAQAEHPIGGDDTTADVERALALLAADLIVRTLDPLIAGELRERPQDDRAASYAPRLIKSDGRIDWKRPAPEVHNHVRAMHPWPHAFSHVDGARYVIHRTAVLERPGPGSPGEIVEAHGDRFIVAAGSGTTIEVLELQPEGRRVMSARDFLAGHQISAGSRFDGPQLA